RSWSLNPGDGIKTVYYEIKNNAGLIIQVTDSIGLDTILPSGSITINDNEIWTTSPNVNLTLTYQDATSGIDQVRFSNDGISWTNWEIPGSDQIWTLTSGDGLKTVFYEIHDKAGLIFQTNDSIGLDTNNPIGSIMINDNEIWTISPNVILTLTYNDATSGVDKVRYSNDGMSWTSWEDPVDNRVWSLTSGDGLKTVYYEIRDQVGKTSSFVDDIGFDMTNPTGSIIINNNDVWTNSTSVSLSLNYNDITSGVDKVRYSNDGISWTSWEDPTIIKLWELPIGDGVSKTIYYEIRDNAGLIIQISDTIGLDTIIPTGSIQINDNDQWTNSQSVILTLTFNDLTSGVDKVRYSNDGISWSSWEAANPTKAWMLSIGDGPSKIVYYEIRDNAGLTIQFTDTIGLDSVSPNGSIIINADNAWTTSSNVILSLTYNDTTSGVDQVRFSNDGSFWTDWEDPLDNKAWIIYGGDNPAKIVYYEIKDNAGLISQISDTIGLDTINPIGTIQINGNNFWTASPNVNLTLTYNDITSGVDQVRYSNDGISWTSWEDPITTRLWILSNGDGPSKTVYYEIKDNAGRISQISDTIGLDTIIPIGTIQINGNNLWTTTPLVTLTLEYSDATSDVSEVRYSNDGTSWTAS
ncbi:MAG: hypothetical protein P8Y97_06855, partial [Candidatus Lokiarchaeota archaeon]